jgi:hypothetical protein
MVFMMRAFLALGREPASASWRKTGSSMYSRISASDSFS